MTPIRNSLKPGLLRRSGTLCVLAFSLLLGACASLPGEGLTRIDPWETYNRQVFEVNEAVDRVAIKPIAETYRAVVPKLVRTGVTNFFRNLADYWTSANLMLQFKPRQSLEMGMRALVNTTLGLGGVMDFAEQAGLERFTVEDFGQTLGYWGLRSGPFLMLPVLGPSTVRDTFGLTLDFKESGFNLIWPGARERYAATALQLINSRVLLLGASNLLDEIALDKYVLLRDAYLAQRRSLIYDGDPPDDESAPAPFNDLIKSDGK